MFTGAVDEASKLDSREARRVLRRVARMLGGYRRQVIVASLVMITWTLTILAGPWLVKIGIDNGITAGSAAVLNAAVVAYIVVAIISYWLYRIQVLLVAGIGQEFLRDLRVRVFSQLQRLSMPYYDRQRAGVIVSRMTSDIDSLAELVQNGLLMFVTSGLMLGVSIVVLAVVSWQLMLVCLVALPPVVAASVKFQRDSNAAYLTVRDRIGDTLSSLQEGISGVRVIQAFARERVEIGRFHERNEDLYEAHIASVRVQAWYLPVIEFAGIGTTALVVGVGGWLIVQDVVTIGIVTFFILTLSNLFEPIQQLSQLFNTLQSAGAGVQKLFEVLDTPIDVPEPDQPVDLPGQGALVVEHVSFAYGAGPEVLHDVCLRVEPGEKLALVGPTGAGKSTLAKLMSRLYDPTGGAVYFGGLDLRSASHDSLRQRIVVVPQEGFLFNGTIRDNVRVARGDATDEEVEAALDVIGAGFRFRAMVEGIDTEVAERGSLLSAGEKQLVSLARAALADPAVLILDEATSSLDLGTEALVEAAMDRLMEGRTVVVIAHRLSTAERADRVGVVDHGMLVECGTHQDLVAAGGRYATLYRTWMGGLSSTV